MKALTMALTIVGTLSLTLPAVAQDGESSLDAWSLIGRLMIQRTQGQAEEAAGYECDVIHDAISDYNAAFANGAVPPPSGGPQWISVLSTISEAAYDALLVFVEQNYEVLAAPRQIEWTWDKAAFCTTIHTDGWLVATDDQLDNDNPYVTITVDGPVVCDPGQLLMIQSGYFFWQGTWQSYYGIDWTESFGGGIPVVSVTFTMRCMDIVPGAPPGVDQVTELVPTAQDNVNPLVTGLTGLETWLWYDFTEPSSHTIGGQITVPARGTTWTLDMTAWVDQIHWDIDCQTECDYHGTYVDFDDNGVDYTLDLPDHRWAPADTYHGGTDQEGQAAATHLYRTKGDYIVSTTVVWRGVYTFAGITYYYDPVVVSTARPYQVVEIRSIITNP